MRYRIEIYDENKANDLTLFSNDGVNREHLNELVFSNLRRFRGNVKAYVFDSIKKKKTVALFLPMTTVSSLNSRKLTSEELGII